MNSFEINKIIAAILFTVLLIYGIGKISDVVFDVKEQSVVAYKVEAPEGSTVEISAESSIDISAFLATGDINHGEKVLLISQFNVENKIRLNCKTLFLKVNGDIGAEALIELVVVRKQNDKIKLVRELPAEIEKIFLLLQEGY